MKTAITRDAAESGLARAALGDGVTRAVANVNDVIAPQVLGLVVAAAALLRRNLWIYGAGGILAPFIGIKLIDLIVHNLLGA